MTTELALDAGRGEPQLTRLGVMRRAMVRRMVEGAAVPCFYLRAGADVTELVALRARLRDSSTGPAPSVNDFIVRAVALELRRHPEVNSAYLENEVATYPRVNVGVAVAIEGGLVVPAVYDAERKTVCEIAGAVRELADLAGRRRLSREVLADATFTVSNLGMYGIDEFDPIINPPQAAILAVGAARSDCAGRLQMRLTLGCDHRVLTGAEAAPFLTAVRERLEQPEGLLPGSGAEIEERA
jgi:pyruvate dehydrogenase E2 component (dihydrolipoyllysine-residue acetyltransferase)